MLDVFLLSRKTRLVIYTKKIDNIELVKAPQSHPCKIYYLSNSSKL